MKTPIQELISEFDKMLENEKYPVQRQAIGQCIRKAHDHLEKEKQMVIEFTDSLKEIRQRLVYDVDADGMPNSQLKDLISMWDILEKLLDKHNAD